ncbi:DUF937 domain-containing protein [Agrococcus sp. DT81.2]|uniref:DUF937 domain-containing protein n=1 Tax=Agrococcus sp. DT81.2 TaxID=3393414 RepID=UPI003CE4D26F
MSEIQQLLGRMPVQQIAQQAGVGEDEARQAIEAIVPALVGGMRANAHDTAGAQSLAGALGAHAGHLDERLAGSIDPGDGQKIVRNVFGDNTEQIARAAGGGSALGGIIQKVLPIVAPIVIAWIANKFSGQGGQGGQPQAPEQGGFGLDDLLGGILGGGAPSPQGGGQQQSGGGPLGPLGDILGGLLGGGRR